MVDLDGAVEVCAKHRDLSGGRGEESGLKVEVGGGIRTMTDIAFYLENGISRVILGSIALRDALLVRQAVAEFGGQIAVGIDARDGMVPPRAGWKRARSAMWSLQSAWRMQACNA
mgnify:CR=1 FL=1